MADTDEKRTAAPPPSPSDVAAPLAAGDEPRLDRLTLHNGIVVGIKAINPRGPREAAARIPPPEVPVVYNDVRSRDEPNPDSPSYKAAVKEWEEECSLAALKVAIILGTHFISAPEGYYGPDADDWIDELEGAYAATGHEPPSIRREGKARYLDWMLYHAAGSDDDTFILARTLLAQTASTESEVQLALAAFRDFKRRLRDLDLAVARGGEHPDPNPA